MRKERMKILIYYAFLRRITNLLCETQKSLWMVCYFVGTVVAACRIQLRWRAMTYSRRRTCVLTSQNVLFIHILLWKLMLKYFIAEQCETEEENIKNISWISYRLVPSSLFSPPNREERKKTVCGILSDGKICLFSIEAYESVFLVDGFLFCFSFINRQKAIPCMLRIECLKKMLMLFIPSSPATRKVFSKVLVFPRNSFYSSRNVCSNWLLILIK